jgi:hypothetical protein
METISLSAGNLLQVDLVEPETARMVEEEVVEEELLVVICF